VRRKRKLKRNKMMVSLPLVEELIKRRRKRRKMKRSRRKKIQIYSKLSIYSNSNVTIPMVDR
jgi:hypothetical protein